MRCVRQQCLSRGVVLDGWLRKSKTINPTQVLLHDAVGALSYLELARLNSKSIKYLSVEEGLV